ncbi:MAG: fructose-bisphosphate aldolase class I [Actinobacteria bacterium]|nr:MAG: fructose-bisphosphate aldolase class I [Actinomycetota bacterium]
MATIQQLQQVAHALVAPGKGILAADESTGSIQKRLESVGVESTEENRPAYREMLLTTKGAGEFISGVIMFDETIRQSTKDGTPFVKALEEAGVLPGIKVDTGAKPLAKAPGETVTEGLDGLRERLIEYRGLGAKFAKWRAVIDIAGDAIPSRYCIDVNAHALARYAALCQDEGIVPIVEPEVLMDGEHDIDRCFAVTCDTLTAVFNDLYDQRVEYEGMLLKPNMVVPGKKSSKQADRRTVAEMTVAALRRCVPASVPGVVFLSGGMSDEDATARLNEMNKLGPHPWELSFSYGRALQAPALKAWKGEPANFEAGQRAFYHRAKMNSLARTGTYSEDMETAA